MTEQKPVQMPEASDDEKPTQATLEIDGDGQIAFGFVLVNEAVGGPERIGDIGVTGYQDLYHRLVEQGWFWKKAAFMAWRAAPRSSRKPDTQDELAKLLNYAGDKVFRNWLGKPEQGPLMLAIIREAAASVFEAHLADVDYVTIEQAKRPDSSINQRELFYKRYREMIPVVNDQDSDDNDLSYLSDDELDAEYQQLADILEKADDSAKSDS